MFSQSRNTLATFVLASFSALVALAPATVWAGPFAPAAGLAGSTAVSKDSTEIQQWATGYQNYLPGSNVADQWKTPELALGQAVGDAFDIVSLGDQGVITLTFDGYITNGDGWDFAVFENGFSDTFLELAFVEVSSDGTTFFRFPSYSFTPAPVGAFGSVDPTNIEGLAGKYRQGWGTPFDLEQLAGKSGLDVNHVSHVRIVDIQGNGVEFDDYPAAYGGPHPIYDLYQTAISGGFDLDAVGARYAVAAVPEPAQAALLAAGLALLVLRLQRRPGV